MDWTEVRAFVILAFLLGLTAFVGWWSGGVPQF